MAVMRAFWLSDKTQAHHRWPRLRCRDVEQPLAVPVSPDLRARWLGWWAPPVQPFRVDALDAQVRARLGPAPQHPPAPSPEVRDTFMMYQRGDWRWLDAEGFAGLPVPERRALMAQRRATQRPKLAPPAPGRTPADPAALERWVASGVAHPSAHAQVPPEVWDAARAVLPHAQRLSGTFPTGSGPNCFGTVLAAAGVEGAEDEWVFPEMIEPWLAEHTTPVRGPGVDDHPGVVLLWHERGTLAHAAVTLGGGWALHKPSQAWCSPRMVWTVRQLIDSWRYPGTRLSRRRLAAAV